MIELAIFMIVMVIIPSIFRERGEDDELETKSEDVQEKVF